MVTHVARSVLQYTVRAGVAREQGRDNANAQRVRERGAHVFLLPPGTG